MAALLAMAMTAVPGMLLAQAGPGEPAQSTPTRPNKPNIFFYWDCEDQADGSVLPNPPFWFGWKTVGPATGPRVIDHPERCAHVRRGPAPQGEKHFEWQISDKDNHDRYTEVKGRGFPVRCTLGKTYYLAYHPNQSGYSARRPVQLEYERWYSCVMAVKMAADRTGSVAVWIDGVKICEYRGIKTCANANPSITQITMGGTIAQPAYDAPAHYRRFDALLLTDNWQNVVDLGYLKGKRQD
ncbi:MAG: heparin lyase I family protein [Candidatus Brocadiae bacterium]|nr:heparin lyase I family protein [Candidatus Brocadiia bacterium]